jgi:hypothetical protein
VKHRYVLILDACQECRSLTIFKGSCLMMSGCIMVPEGVPGACACPVIILSAVDLLFLPWFALLHGAGAEQDIIAKKIKEGNRGLMVLSRMVMIGLRLSSGRQEYPSYGGADV